MINEAVVLEFWEVHELEFYWDSTLKSTKLMMDSWISHNRFGIFEDAPGH